MREIIHEAMARALFVDAWANAMEEAGKLPGQCELMDVAPPTSHQALQEAKTLYFDIEQENDVHLDEFVPPGYTEDSFGTTEAELFGHYLAMEALGHGVAWSDDNEDHGLKVGDIYPDIWIDVGTADEGEEG